MNPKSTQPRPLDHGNENRGKLTHPLHRLTRKEWPLSSINRDIASIRSKQSLINLFEDKLKKLFYFQESNILLLGADKNQLITILTVPDIQVSGYEKYHWWKTSYSTSDPFLMSVFKSKTFVSVDHQNLTDDFHESEFIGLRTKKGFSRSIAVPLVNGVDIFGVLTFSSDAKESLGAGIIELVSEISIQLAATVSYLTANEELVQSEKEKSILLSLSEELARVRDKNDLYNVIRNNVRNIFSTFGFVIGLIDEEVNAHYAYLIDHEEIAEKHVGFDDVRHERFPVNDGVFNQVIDSDEPVVFNLNDLTAQASCPLYVKFWKLIGLQYIMGMRLQAANKILGVIWLQPGTTPLNVVCSVACQLSIALSNILFNDEINYRNEEKSLLLSISNEIATIRDKNDLLAVFNNRLKKLIHFNHSVMGIVNEANDGYLAFLLDPASRTRDFPNYDQLKTEVVPLNKGMMKVAIDADFPVVFDLEEAITQEFVPEFIKVNHQLGIKEVVVVALRSEKGNLGCLMLFSDEKNSFNPNILAILNGIGFQLSTSIRNITANEDISRREQEKSLILSFSNDIASVKNKSGLAEVINCYLKNLSLVKEYILTVKNDDNETHSYFLYDSSASYARHPEFEKIKKHKYPISEGLTAVVLSSEEPVVFDVNQVLQEGKLSFPSGLFWKSLGFDRVLAIKLTVGMDNIGILWTLPDEINGRLLKGISSQIAVAVANSIANEKIQKQFLEINRYKQQLEEENNYLHDEIETKYNYSEIIGSGAEMEKIFYMISQVASTPSTVLILGETGTGKELIARAIHNESARKDKLMVKVNCAALPPSLIESELFGHERGSFTGATDRRLGKFELANHGTLFLDEIGEMPLDLQVKLLRAIQEREIERVGGKGTIKVDVRIIAATNRDLQKEVAEGRFRSDLFYRLNVFPMTVPSLKSRKEDIKELTAFFIKRYSRTTGKKIIGISNQVQQDMLVYPWPGNVRELEHIIERSIIMTAGNIIKEIHLPTIDDRRHVLDAEEFIVKTIDENERDHILHVIKMCKGKISGPGGAADLLGVHPSTLNSKISKLKITKKQIFDQLNIAR